MKYVVLIVEDELLLRLHLADQFREAGYVVFEAATANHALEFCCDVAPIHVLITDIQLGKCTSGWELARKFRARWRNVHVVYTSGNAFDGSQAVPDSLFFGKPYRSAEIVGRCQQFLARGRV
jgi:two-component system, response regulator PdtaR